MKKKLYISLPISGRPLAEAKAQAAEMKARMEGKGYDVVTPFEINPDSTRPYSEMMGRCIERLLECDAVCFARFWVMSEGCRLERTAAKIYGIEIVEP